MARLKLVGYCRPEDQERVQFHRDKCKELGLEPYVEFHLGVDDRYVVFLDRGLFVVFICTN